MQGRRLDWSHPKPPLEVKLHQVCGEPVCHVDCQQEGSAPHCFLFEYFQNSRWMAGPEASMPMQMFDWKHNSAKTRTHKHWGHCPQKKLSGANPHLHGLPIKLRWVRFRKPSKTPCPGLPNRLCWSNVRVEAARQSNHENLLLPGGNAQMVIFGVFLTVAQVQANGAMPTAEMWAALWYATGQGFRRGLLEKCRLNYLPPCRVTCHGESLLHTTLQYMLHDGRMW